jgi:hypothetical protein
LLRSYAGGTTYFNRRSREMYAHRRSRVRVVPTTTIGCGSMTEMSY